MGGGEKLDLVRIRFRRSRRRTASLLASLRPVVAILDPLLLRLSTAKLRSGHGEGERKLTQQNDVSMQLYRRDTRLRDIHS